LDCAGLAFNCDPGHLIGALGVRGYPGPIMGYHARGGVAGFFIDREKRGSSHRGPFFGEPGRVFFAWAGHVGKNGGPSSI